MTFITVCIGHNTYQRNNDDADCYIEANDLFDGHYLLYLEEMSGTAPESRKIHIIVQLQVLAD